MILTVGLSAFLLTALASAAWAPVPGRTPSAVELRALLVATFALYGAAVAAALCHRAGVAELACAGGVAASALAGWLSRGSAGSGPGGGDDSGPIDGSGGPPVDWDGFDRARRSWDRPRAHSRR